MVPVPLEFEIKKCGIAEEKDWPMEQGKADMPIPPLPATLVPDMIELLDKRAEDVG